VASSQNVDDHLQDDNCCEAGMQRTAEGQQELIEKVLKNVAVASEVLQHCLCLQQLGLAEHWL